MKLAKYQSYIVPLGQSIVLVQYFIIEKSDYEMRQVFLGCEMASAKMCYLILSHIHGIHIDDFVRLKFVFSTFWNRVGVVFLLHFVFTC